MQENHAVSSRVRYRSKRRPLAGIGLIEVIFALFIFVMMGLMFAAVIPAANRSTRYSNSYVMASQLAQHKIDQIRDAGFTRCNGDNLAQDGLIDSATPFAINGTARSFEFTDADSLLEYFPDGASGIVTIDNYLPSYNGSEYSIRQVQVEVRWREGNGPENSYSTAALLAAGGD